MNNEHEAEQDDLFQSEGPDKEHGLRLRVVECRRLAAEATKPSLAFSLRELADKLESKADQLASKKGRNLPQAWSLDNLG